MVKILESNKKLDVRGLYCPSPVMQTVVELAIVTIEYTGHDHLLEIKEHKFLKEGFIEKQQYPEYFPFVH